MRIIADRNIPGVAEIFSEFGRVTLAKGRDIHKNLLKNSEILLVRSVTKVDRELLENTPIRFVGTATIGTDHVEKSWLDRNGIGFSAAPGSNALSVAQYVTCALIHLASKLSIDLRGKTLGIIGLGNVGSRVAVLVEALGVKCLYNDPPLQGKKPDMHFSSLEETLQFSDIISVHVPLTVTGKYPTRGMADTAFFSAMKPGALFINTSRGGVVSEQALREAREKLAAVVLDVWQNEPDINLETLAATDIATPHIAGYSFDGKINGMRMIYEAACEFFNRKPHFKDLFPALAECPVAIDVRQAANPLLKALQEAYPIMEDDALMRRIAHRQDRGAYFDSLRQEYRKRLEFEHFTVLLTKKQHRETEILQKLGFAVTVL